MFQVGVLVCGSHGKLSACLAKLRLQIKLLKRHFNHRFCGTKTIFHFLSKHYVGRIDYYLQKSIPNIKLGWAVTVLMVFLGDFFLVMHKVTLGIENGFFLYDCESKGQDLFGGFS